MKSKQQQPARLEQQAQLEQQVQEQEHAFVSIWRSLGT